MSQFRQFRQFWPFGVVWLILVVVTVADHDWTSALLITGAVVVGIGLQTWVMHADPSNAEKLDQTSDIIYWIGLVAASLMFVFCIGAVFVTGEVVRWLVGALSCAVTIYVVTWIHKRALETRSYR